jgi:hypothetical protein
MYFFKLLREAECRHFLCLQTQPGIFKQNFFFLLAFFVLHASHDSGVGALVGSAVVGALVGSAVGGIGSHLLFLHLHPGIFKQFFFLLFALKDLHFAKYSGVGESVALNVGEIDGVDVTDGSWLGPSDGYFVGMNDGEKDGIKEGEDVGSREGLIDGVAEGECDGFSDGLHDGINEGEEVGFTDGSEDGIFDGLFESDGSKDGSDDTVGVSLIEGN